MFSPNGGGDLKRARYGLIWRIKLKYSETKPLWDQGFITVISNGRENWKNF